jgi:hypothetical protein
MDNGLHRSSAPRASGDTFCQADIPLGAQRLRREFYWNDELAKVFFGTIGVNE